MKRSMPLLLLAIATASCASEEPAMEEAQYTPGPEPVAAFAATPEVETEVVAVVQALFDALETGDADLLREVLDPSVVMHFSESRDGVTTFGSSDVEGLAARITSSEAPLIERMWNPTVWMHGALATVWTEYDFYAGTDFSHCGVDAANLLRTEAGWRIVALTWTRAQPPECALHPDGPPR